jgi:hypothetical protein
VLLNKGLKPSKLHQHLKIKHRDCANIPLTFFQRELKELNESSKALHHSATGSSNSKTVEALYQVGFANSKTRKAAHVHQHSTHKDRPQEYKQYPTHLPATKITV